MKIRPTLIALILVATQGCLGPDTSKFVGLWKVSGANSVTLHTPDGPRVIGGEAVGDRTIVEADDADLVIASNGCNVPAQVDGEVAQLRAGHTCTQKNEDASVTYTFTSGSVVAGRSSLTFTASGTLILVTGGQSYSGTFQINETLTKIGK